MTDNIDFRGPITKEQIDLIRQRNEEKLKAAKEYLGAKWLLHPTNQIKKVKKKR